MKYKHADDEFLSLMAKYRHEEKVSDSRFIATALPVESEAEATAFVEEIKSEFHDASHNCFAWRIGIGKSLRYRFSDAGEPAGTAGRPIMKAIEARRFSNVCVVVTRYFGGTKLGTGGLIRAYGRVASELLRSCESEKKFLSRPVTFSVDFDFVNVAHNVISAYKAELKDSQYGDYVTFIVEVRSSQLKAFMEKLTDATNGRVEFK